jgi:hypothetical protein
VSRINPSKSKISALIMCPIDNGAPAERAGAP